MSDLENSLNPVAVVDMQFKTEVTPQMLQELFERDPEELSNKDVDIIVTELRKQRALFKQQEVTKKTRTKAAPKKSLNKEEVGQLSLGSLGLGPIGE